MKKTRLLLLWVAALLAIVLALSLPTLAAAGNTVLVFRGAEQTEHEIAIEVTVEENSGVCAMLLSLDYDATALTLTGLTYGTAFSSLEPLHTNTDTAEGYGVHPFRISYLGEENDTSTGEMMTLYFRVKEDAPDGAYTVTFSYDRDKDVTYLADGGIRTKNLLIDSAVITLQGREVLEIETHSAANTSPQQAQKGGNSVILYVVIGGAAEVGIGVGAVLLITKQNKKKKWIKL